MKALKFVLLSIAMVSMSFDRPSDTLTDAERKYVANLLQETRDDLVTKVKNLSPTQLNFKPGASTWSVAECVEHIAISENNIFGFAMMGLKEPADPSRRSEIKMKDDEIVTMISDRSTKRKTQEAFEPTGKFGSFEATLKEFINKRDGTIRFVKTTSDDLRNHYNDFPFGKLDSYQTILFMAAHSKRHTAQIEEVMNQPDFPKK